MLTANSQTGAESDLAFLFPFGYRQSVPTSSPIKPLVWIAGSKRDLMAMPEEVQDMFGYALHLAQSGGKHDQAKPLKGQGSAGVLEVVEDWQGDTYRAVYTVKFATAIYVLHCFQKKATRGIATPKPELNLIASRLKVAEAHAKGAKS
jgi:phage-related protein